MNKSILLLVILASIAGGCKQKAANTNTQLENMQTDTLNIQQELIDEILCDSIYGDRNYKIVMQFLPYGEAYDTVTYKNMIFQLFAKQELIYQDTLFSQHGFIEFMDFDGDHVKDILINNHITSTNSSLGYHLLTVDTAKNKVKKIKGFKQIYNPEYLPEYSLIKSRICSAKCRTYFYEIQNDTIRDFDICLTGSDDYDREYENAIAKIMAIRKAEKKTTGSKTSKINQQ
jgi:hypothetical protein